MSLELPELPRHVKKPGGQWKRVENETELAAALADGWVIRLSDAPEAPSGVVLTDAPAFSYGLTANERGELVHAPFEPAEPIPDVLDDPDGAPPAESDEPDPTPKRGRPRKGA